MHRTGHGGRGSGQPSLRISYDNGLLKDYELFVPVSTSLFLTSVPGISFDIQQIQGIAIPRVITVTNTTQATGTAPQPSLTGDPEFALAGNTCAAPLAPHQSCVLAVQFKPVIAGSRSAILFVGNEQVQLFGQGEFNSVVQISPLQLTFLSCDRAPAALYSAAHLDQHFPRSRWPGGIRFFPSRL